jgi:hypothetical protein
VSDACDFPGDALTRAKARRRAAIRAGGMVSSASFASLRDAEALREGGGAAHFRWDPAACFQTHSGPSLRLGVKEGGLAATSYLLLQWSGTQV